MPTLKSWKDTLKLCGAKNTLNAKDLYTAECAAYRAFESRVEEMKRSGRGVLPHEGNNQKTIITGTLSLLVYGDKEHFNKQVKDIQQKASQDPVHYSPVSYALSAAERLLGNVDRSAKSIART